MANFPGVTGREAVRAFERIGFRHVRTNGSHYIMKRASHRFLLSVPVHGKKNIGVGLLMKLIQDAGLTPDEFLMLL